MEPTRTRQPVPAPAASPSHVAPWRTVEQTAAAEPSFVKLGCSLCRASFLLDVEEHWIRRPEEMEEVGRKFLGVGPDAALCPRCLHEVETAGAERIYWSVALC